MGPHHGQGLLELPNLLRNNIHIHLVHRLLSSIAQRAKLCISGNLIFWKDSAAFECFLARLTVARCGERVRREFCSLLLGGACQSLQSLRTAQLGPILGKCRACFEMNISLDEEKRESKQGSNLVGKFVATGCGVMRGIAYSKFEICATDLPQRLPYAIQTTLFEMREYRRFESNSVTPLLACNKLIAAEVSVSVSRFLSWQPRFAGVDGNTVDLIWRRQPFQICSDYRGGASEAEESADDGLSLSRRIEMELEDVSIPQSSDIRQPAQDVMPAPSLKRSSADMQHAAIDVMSLLTVNESNLLEGKVPDVQQAEQGSILNEVAELRQFLTEHSQASQWPAPLQHVAQGAIAVHRLRLLDISRREEVLFLELIEGSGRNIRAHAGQCFFFERARPLGCVCWSRAAGRAGSMQTFSAALRRTISTLAT